MFRGRRQPYSEITRGGAMPRRFIGRSTGTIDRGIDDGDEGAESMEAAGGPAGYRVDAPDRGNTRLSQGRAVGRGTDRRWPDVAGEAHATGHGAGESGPGPSGDDRQPQGHARCGAGAVVLA